jgi:hypothetical protein
MRRRVERPGGLVGLITRRSQAETAPLLACSVLPNSVL